MSFLVLVGIARTLTVEHALCRTIPESYGENKVSLVGFLPLWVGISCGSTDSIRGTRYEKFLNFLISSGNIKILTWNPYPQARGMVMVYVFILVQ